MADNDFGPTYGAMLISILVSTALYGVTSLQAFLYFQKFGKEDRWGLVSTVALVWSLETAHVFLIGHYLYWNLLTNYCNPSSLLTTSQVDDATTGVTAIITVIVQCFFVRRLYILSRKNLWLSGTVLFLALVHFGLEIAVMGLTYKYPRYDQFHLLTPYFTTALVLAAAVDLIIAGALCFFLVEHRTGMENTDTLLNKLVKYTISSGLLTSVTDVIILICFLTMPDNLIFLSIYGIINNFYANSLLATLNARRSLRAAKHNELSWSRIQEFRFSQASQQKTHHPGHTSSAKNAQSSRYSLPKFSAPNTPITPTFLAAVSEQSDHESDV